MVKLFHVYVWEVLRDTFLFKGFQKLSNFNLLLTPDPCLSRSLFLFFLNSWVLEFLRVAKGFRLALTDCGGAMEQEASTL